MRLEAYPVKQTAYLSMTSIFIRRGNFAYDPVKGFLESPWPQGGGERQKGIHEFAEFMGFTIYLYLLPSGYIYDRLQADTKGTSS